MRRLITALSRFAAIAAFAMIVLLPVQALAAYNPLGTGICSDPEAKASSAVCKTDAGDPIAGPDGVLLKATRIIAVIAGIAAVIVIVIAGIRYITSGGAADQIAQAKNTIIFALVGLLIIVSAQAIISFIIIRL